MNEDVYVGDTIINDRLHEIGKDTQGILPLKDQKQLEKRALKDKKMSQYKPGSVVLLDFAKHKMFLEKETYPKVMEYQVRY